MRVRLRTIRFKHLIQMFCFFSGFCVAYLAKLNKYDFLSRQHHEGSSQLALKLSGFRIFCLTLTNQEDPADVSMIKIGSETWANHCDQSIFIGGGLKANKTHLLKLTQKSTYVRYPNFKRNNFTDILLKLSETISFEQLKLNFDLILISATTKNFYLVDKFKSETIGDGNYYGRVVTLSCWGEKANFMAAFALRTAKFVDVFAPVVTSLRHLTLSPLEWANQIFDNQTVNLQDLAFCDCDKYQLRTLEYFSAKLKPIS